ncbi:hypothetical protein [Seleniivibrio woodruffii]|uniref:hypothetical protein n=1 Tax=Seleniivibrio woodruffii TaxID=1078050 RepID=UPI0024095A43|nr:hypothetical protein [Seleniivibrio woodruffii]
MAGNSKGSEYLNRKLELAGRPDSKVVMTRTPESHILYLIMSQADIGISTLKMRLFQEGYSAEEVESLIKEFYAKCRELEKVVEKLIQNADLNTKKQRS